MPSFTLVLVSLQEQQPHVNAAAADNKAAETVILSFSLFVCFVFVYVHFLSYGLQFVLSI